MGMHVDVVIIGAGAAGLMAAGVAGQRGLRVLLIDHAPKLAEKIRISGGGRSNFTNLDVTAANYLSQNSNFCRSALSQYTQQDFLSLVKSHGIAFHEKHKGQLFCDRSSQDLIDMLVAECAQGRVERWQPCQVNQVSTAPDSVYTFRVQTQGGEVRCRQVVVATGGLSIPKIGASDWGYRLAEQFGHRVVPLRPALVPMTFDHAAWSAWSGLSGIALPVRMQVSVGEDAPFDVGQRKAKGKTSTVSFDEDLLFTHRGLTGPAMLQISSHWMAGQPLCIDLLPNVRMDQVLTAAKSGARKQLGNAWHELTRAHLPQRLTDAWLAQQSAELGSLRTDALLADCKDKELQALGHSLHQWRVVPNGTEGYAKAEVTAGGVDTQALDSRTMQSKRQAGLYFIGEVVDVTGWLGGYNFQWAWSSAVACARSLLPAEAEDAKGA